MSCRRIAIWLWPLIALVVGGCAANAPRQDLSLDHGWKFIRRDVPDAAAGHFDDSAWQSVALPHTWNAQDGQDGGNNYYRGPAWYRRHFSLSDSIHSNDRRFFLRFGAASTVSEVYVNGWHAGQHRGGFGAFCFDITDHLARSGDNVIAVKVDNSRFDDVPALAGDFTICGGLYRDVHVLSLDPLHISPLDDGSCGVYWKQSNVSAASADLEMTAKLRNDSSKSKTASIEFCVIDKDGTVVGLAISEQHMDAHGEANASAKMTIRNPHLWNGRANPYLYRAICRVNEKGRRCDEVTQSLGFRSLQVDPDRGFILNGRPYDLHGVNYHQDRIDKGWAANQRDREEDYGLIAEMGCTAVRMCHYQHSEEDYALCDKLGLIVWAELGMVNEMGTTPAFADNARQQLRELIKQNFNHPSIAFWSLFNELHLKDRRSPEDFKLVTELNQLAHELDPTRITTAGSNLDVDHPVHRVPDVLGFNRYWGWYSEGPERWPAELDKHRAALPDARIGISEFGAAASVRQHAMYPTRPAPHGPWHPEEWQAIFHEHAWPALKDRPWLWGKFVWQMFDTASDGRNEGDRPGRNDKGLVTGDRKTRKDAFYFYKANWSDEPVVQITSKRFNPRPLLPAKIKVYSNCDGVELFVNGRSLGRKTAANCVFVWSDVSLVEGENTVRAVGSRGGTIVDEQCVLTVSRSATTQMTTSN